MQGKLFIFICAVALKKGVLSNADPLSVCSDEESDGKLVAHQVCNKYFICNHGVPTTMSCPRGLLYNPHKEVCDWPQKVECGDRIIVEEVQVDNNENSDNSNESNNENNGNNILNCNPDKASLICSAEGSDDTLVAHEICSNFFICTHGVPTTMTCSKGLLYNPCIEQCDWPHNVECGNRIIVAEPEDRSYDNSNGDSESHSRNGICNCNQGEPPLICAVEDSDGTLVAHEVCNKYYVCNHGILTTMNCPTGLLYNPHIGVCDWPNNVVCGNRVIVKEATFFLTKHNSTKSENENNSNESASSNMNGGNDTYISNPAEALSTCAAEDSEGTLIAHEVCYWFYICEHGIPKVRICPDGLMYHQYNGQCDWPHNVDCGDRVLNEEEIKNHSDEESSDENNDNDVHIEPEINLFEIAKTKCAETESDGYMSIHENCHQFYVCFEQEPAVLSCPLGLLYDTSSQTCGWPQNVQCGERTLIEN